MTLVSMLVVIVLVGLAVWAITTLVPMPANFQKAIKVLAIVWLVLYILSGLGLIHLPFPLV